MGLYGVTRFKPNRFDGYCFECGGYIRVGQGMVRKDPHSGKLGVRHTPRQTVYPTGPWDKFEPYEVGGCPKAAINSAT